MKYHKFHHLIVYKEITTAGQWWRTPPTFRRKRQVDLCEISHASLQSKIQ